ncbi:SDR family oxidoreductase [Actinomycetospora sp. NBRC 106378]|uniref:SDR family NAD(P)-dependent oxidoreductase n=1 Tax=Actinomycetospora sp. NBRC 106378 TaxID=3032208 RepID=UPI0024A57E97|nr:SDR family oxidoreductase [Actinomycetospora sp. NBRC 106378]GLZ53506.1 SDR family oxidoreductase [Actinomycetospora sp. NBRC 106378]
MSTALITGASSGIGAVYADRLARRGDDLILVARNRDRLEALAARLIEETGRKVEVLAADLADEVDLARVEEVLRSERDITVLVNNAGVGGVGPLVESDVDAVQAMITLNVTALTRLTYAYVPGAVERGEGTVINIGSVVGVAPEFLNGVYGATKAYVLALTQSLQHELAATDVRAQAVLPNATATEFWDVAGRPLSNPDGVMSAEDLVDAALVDLDRGQLVSIPPLQDQEQWEAYESARGVLKANFGSGTPAPRYANA